MWQNILFLDTCKTPLINFIRVTQTHSAGLISISVADRLSDRKTIQSGLPLCLYNVWSCLSIINSQKQRQKNRLRGKKSAYVWLCVTGGNKRLVQSCLSIITQLCQSSKMYLWVCLRGWECERWAAAGLVHETKIRLLPLADISPKS